jgi:hypothetical protein
MVNYDGNCYTYGMEVIYEGQRWIVDQIQKVNVKIAKDIAGLKATHSRL